MKHTQRVGAWPLIVLIALAPAACEDRSPSGPDGSGGDEYLVGGGRAVDGDSFVGGREDSGPVSAGREPGKPDIEPDYPAIFYSDVNCFPGPFTGAVRSESEWSAWWKTATSCQPKYLDPVGGGGTPGDLPQRTDPVKPDSTLPGVPTDPAQPPIVDFSLSSVIVIGLDAAKGWGRQIQVTDVSTSSSGATTVRFEVLTPGEDCARVLMSAFDPDAIVTSPVIAVIVRGQLGTKVEFVRTDAVWHCIVEPDPKEPLTLYYTDGECDLGGAEAVIRDGARWDAWLATAVACERDRWGSPTEPALPKDLPVRDASGSYGSTTLAEPPSGWLSPGVDFSTHAVVVLRAPSQTRWGGGVWLTGIELRRGGGTTIAYSVMTPGRTCPTIDQGGMVRPTTAIRVPLLLPDPVAFTKTVETIDCRWKEDGGGSSGGGTVPPSVDTATATNAGPTTR